jgi:hypothetical protein
MQEGENTQKPVPKRHLARHLVATLRFWKTAGSPRTVTRRPAIAFAADLLLALFEQSQEWAKDQGISAP